MTQNASCIFHNGDESDDDYNESDDVDDRGGGGGGDEIHKTIQKANRKIPLKW